MNRNKIVIEIPQDKMELIKKLGLSPRDVFYKGLQASLRQKYREFNLMEEDDEDDDIFWIDVSSFSKEMNEADTYMVNDHDLSNN
jgi:CRISPR/Cas system endoribonuclease Cas6 (RAMP superfamily)